ncbi:MAG: ribosome maturation factor RimM [Proteobacteria bacterium]|nr:ribosome maturation factor RimM [Pseudomonadota bacterium]HQR03704.1 ribosome maturation factor RimM [Rhodocyclaceae bacterium]
MIVLGRIVAPYGVAGWVHIHPFGDDPAAWKNMPAWWLAPEAESASWQVRALAGFKAHGDGWVARFDGVNDRSGAEALKGFYLGAPREALPEAGNGEYYWADLVGLAMVNLEGEALGTVVSLIETGANDVLVVQEGETERLLPFVDAVVKEVDVPGGTIRVDWARDW